MEVGRLIDDGKRSFWSFSSDFFLTVVFLFSIAIEAINLEATLVT